MKQVRRKAQAGFTIIEMVLAAGLMTILIVALVGLTNTSMTIWNRTERTRDLQEMGAAVMGLFAEDLGALEGSRRGDMLADWEVFDVDRDNIKGLYYPRLRMLRQATAADLKRRSLRRLEELASNPELDENGEPIDLSGVPDPRARALVEVCWALLPSGAENIDERSLGALWRGERLLDDDSLPFFDENYFTPSGKPTVGSLEYVTGGVLWFEPSFASQTSIIHTEWKLGSKLEDCGTGWDAWGKERSDQELTPLNAWPTGIGKPGDLPLFPRRVRVVLELERPKDLKFRTKLSEAIQHDSTELPLRDSDKLPAKGGMVLIGEEWMEVGDRGPGYVLVLRGRRGTLPASHPRGSLVHYGMSIERELLVPVSREEWN